MASITIRKLDQATKEKLRIRAALAGHSMEEEARTILRAALWKKSAGEDNLAELIKKRFQPLEGIELQLPERGPVRHPPVPGG